MNTYLFGGSGFLGPVILEKYPEIVSVGRSAPPDYVTNRHIQIDTLDDLSVLDDEQIDNVIFLIGCSDHHYLNGQIVAGIDKNVYPLKKALAYFSKRKLNKFICFTTTLLYDKVLMKQPVTETEPINPYINEYVFSKYLSEEIVSFYRESVPTIIIRCSNIYGPTKLVRPDLVPTLIQNLLSPNDVSVWSKKPIRDFIYLEDAADVLIKLLQTSYTGHVNLATGTSTSVGNICDILENLSGKKITDKDIEVSGPMEFYCDTTLLNTLTNWNPTFTIEQGLTKTFERMKQWAHIQRGTW